MNEDKIVEFFDKSEKNTKDTNNKISFLQNKINKIEINIKDYQDNLDKLRLKQSFENIASIILINKEE